MEKLPNPHDRFFKELFSPLPTARDFIRHYLPKSLGAAIDLRTLTVVKESFLDEELRNYFSDMLFRARRKQGGDVLIYILLEHKSAPDALVALQLFLYLARIWYPHFQNKQKPLPLVIPVVFYHGSQKWNVSRQFSALFDFTGVEALREFLPEFKYHLCDLSKMEINKGQPRLRAGLATLKYVSSHDLPSRLGEIFQTIKLLPRRPGFLYLKTVLTYLTRAAKKLKRESIQLGLHDTFPEHEEVLMQTIAEQWIEEGMQQMALRILKNRFGTLSTKATRQVHALPMEYLEKLSDVFLNFKSEEELLVWLQKAQRKH